MTTTNVKISQRSAILIERLRSEGISDEQLLAAIEQHSVAPLSGSATAAGIDLLEWLDYAAEHGEQLTNAVREGYRMTFTTVPGAGNWLRFALGLEEGADYTVPAAGRIEGLQLNEAQFQRTASALAINWIIVRQPDGNASVMLTSLQ
ncbi:hypothetical protein [Paenibacillus campi]|uniref:hypothetical protein n=1 Tax=Paenibacillus campi TaxID=3106031 RepID=UPI002AFF96CF|nr:hypothetical protein [Paenibacillus sp. SGZ-1014]